MIRAVLIALFFVSFSFAQTYYLNVKTKDGTQTFAISDVGKITFANVTDVKDLDKLQNALKTFSLLQNYPNPFNPSTTIEYTLPNSGNVELKIFDINGKLVRTLENSFKGTGYHKTVWDSKNENGQTVASGAYLYQVRTGATAISKKMIFIK
ncbi:MAG: T9SS type A sorting domain-containing protein [Ignavibacteriaceae bacterium]|jgi:hypothetical protein